jgi:S-adenosylmethionine:tRNA ribosyltransferase-isomerase
MKISDYDYELPEELIADRPPEQRGSTRLLVLDKKTGAITHRKYADLADYLEAGDMLVLNNTKVIKARLIATNSDGKSRELLLIEKHGKDFGVHQHKVLYRGRIRPDEELMVNERTITVKEVLDGGLAIVQTDENLLDLAERYGEVPLPPYMKRQADQTDTERYQTVFAHDAGSVAAPTASLNFTKELEAKLKAKGVHIAYLTLHVGLGTFLPIRTDSVEEHQMHSEYYEVPTETVAAIQQAKQSGNKVCAIGTTVTRTLEYCANDILGDQPQNLSGEANIFIYPGFEFKIVDQLLTNFHAPRSTVLMLTAAFASWDNLKTAYQTAITEEYAFLSYGDSMLIY